MFLLHAVAVVVVAATITHTTPIILAPLGSEIIRRVVSRKWRNEFRVTNTPNDNISVLSCGA